MEFLQPEQIGLRTYGFSYQLVANSLLKWDLNQQTPTRNACTSVYWEAPQAYLGKNVENALDHRHARRFNGPLTR